ncbi:hypothetical protein C8F01DRAFT_1142816 [Mycena amicta]|nr:hypothetical protein C8F01DRAFT_1142816 [Mycena amicta]
MPEPQDMSQDISQDISKTEHDSLQSNAALVADSPKRSRETSPTDASDGPVAKRARSSRRHVKHWDLDGDIFVRLDDCWMRLRKSSLARHSEFFNDIFTAIEQGKLAPEPKRPYEEGTLILADVSNVHNCYHVLAPGISSADLDALLTAIEDAISYCHQPPSFPVVASILRASSVLKFPRFRDWAQRTIQTSWSPSLGALTASTIPHATDVVSLGRDIDLGSSGPDVLKRALYEVLRTPSFSQNPDQHLTTLHSSDLITLTRAREHLDTVWYTATSFDFFSSFCLAHGNEPQSQPRCTPLTYEMHKHLIHDSAVFTTYRYDVLCGLEMLCKIGWDVECTEEGEGAASASGAGMCSLCAKRVREQWKSEREQAWKKLDTIFSLQMPITNEA